MTVVLDFGCDGDITGTLKADANTKHIPVIALVGMLRLRSKVIVV